MASQRSVEVRRYPEQLTLALAGWLSIGERIASIVTSAHAQRLPSRDTRGRFVAGARVLAQTPRLRTLPPRDSRGRFVGYPTTSAPSWYVFCCDGYRIPSESAPAPLPSVAPTAQDAPPRGVRRSPRPRFTRSELQSAFLMLIVLIVSAWYGFHLPPPHR
jgi:hypothetical protein